MTNIEATAPATGQILYELLAMQDMPMNREIIRAVSKPEVQQRLRHDGMITEVMSVEQLKHYIDTETARWKPVLEQAGLIGN